MNMDQAAVFLAASILTVLGFIVFVIGAVVINNILHKFWKPINWSQHLTFPPKFIAEEDLKKDKEPKFK